MSIYYRKILSVFSLIGSLGAVTALSMTIPIPAQAESKQIQLLLDSQGSLNFATLLQQAESVVRNSVEKTFGENPNLTDVSITIVGEHNGAVVPLLSTTVSRANWLVKPNIQAWSQYFSTAEVLLGFRKPLTPATSTASATNFNPVAASMADKEANFYQ